MLNNFSVEKISFLELLSFVLVRPGLALVLDKVSKSQSSKMESGKSNLKVRVAGISNELTDVGRLVAGRTLGEMLAAGRTSEEFLTAGQTSEELLA